MAVNPRHAGAPCRGARSTEHHVGVPGTRGASLGEETRGKLGPCFLGELVGSLLHSAQPASFFPLLRLLDLGGISQMSPLPQKWTGLFAWHHP